MSAAFAPPAHGCPLPVDQALEGLGGGDVRGRCFFGQQ